MSVPVNSLVEFCNTVVAKLEAAGLPDAANVHRPGQKFDPNSPTAHLAARLVAEEAVELMAAMVGGEEAIGIMDDVLSVTDPDEEPSEEGACKELTDVLFVSYRIAVLYDWLVDAAFNRTHDNNMLKTINATVRPDGKIKKAPDHPKVYLKDLI